MRRRVRLGAIAAIALLGVPLGFWASAWAKAPTREPSLPMPTAAIAAGTVGI